MSHAIEIANHWEAVRAAAEEEEEEEEDVGVHAQAFRRSLMSKGTPPVAPLLPSPFPFPFPSPYFGFAISVLFRSFAVNSCNLGLIFEFAVRRRRWWR